MDNIDYGIDPELVLEFVDESQEMLGNVTNIFIKLEKDPRDKESIDTIFRAVHTIKGNSAFFNLMKVKALAHSMEDLMDLVREGALSYSEELSSTLIRGIDLLKKMLENVRENNPEIDDEAPYNALLAEISAHGESPDIKDTSVLLQELLGEARIFEKLLSEKSDEILSKNWAKISRALEMLAPTPETTKKEKALQNPKNFVLSVLSGGIDENIDPETAESILRSLEKIKETALSGEGKEQVEEAISAFENTVPQEGFTPFLAEIIENKIKNVPDIPSQKKPAKEISEPRSSEPSASDMPDKSSSSKTMRVYESKIDAFMDFIGELVTVGEMYDHIHKRLADIADDKDIVLDNFRKDVTGLKKNNELFNELSTSLQKSVLDIRRVPIKNLLQRAPRIVHDISSSKNKEIKVDINGEETLIDKSLLENIEGPFVHLVRNSADHGIENPDLRISKGKSREGTVRINVAEDETSLFISIEDDGGGIDTKAILDKAVSSGLITKERSDTLQEQEIYQLLFAPGFSTANEVTEISGRGVGMDVVKKNLDSCGGQIQIESVPGQGSKFTISVPKTVAVKIIEGFLVESSSNRFVIPLKMVGESFVIRDKDITKTGSGQQECILHHGAIFPVYRLNSMLGLIGSQDTAPEDSTGIGVIISTRGREAVLIVDGVLGTQQVVVKDIEGITDITGLVAGGAILGDEKVAIVLDLETLGEQKIANATEKTSKEATS